MQEANALINENDNKQELRTVIRGKDKELENIFNQILQDLEHCTILEMYPRENLTKFKVTSDTEESANRILDVLSSWKYKYPSNYRQGLCNGKTNCIKVWDSAKTG